MYKSVKAQLQEWVIRLSGRFGSRPDPQRIHEALSQLYQDILAQPGQRGYTMDLSVQDKLIIFSDQHKGARDRADDFMLAEPNYLAALDHYHASGFHYVNLGDSEELWENRLEPVIRHNEKTFAAEKRFLDRQAFTKIFGNHDLYWDNDPLAAFSLNRIYGQQIKVYEGLVLNIDVEGRNLHIFLTHGHQGDLQSDGNWLSKWFVSNVWAPLQSYLEINPNTPAYDDQLKTEHNRLMYEWQATQDGLALITGHTHQPVFASLTHLERIYLRIKQARERGDETDLVRLNEELQKRVKAGDTGPEFKVYQPGYFNSGCCCFSDGDITGLEIEAGFIRLIKWSSHQTGIPERLLLEEMKLSELLS